MASPWNQHCDNCIIIIIIIIIIDKTDDAASVSDTE